MCMFELSKELFADHCLPNYGACIGYVHFLAGTPTLPIPTFETSMQTQRNSFPKHELFYYLPNQENKQKQSTYFAAAECLLLFAMFNNSPIEKNISQTNANSNKPMTHSFSAQKNLPFSKRTSKPQHPKQNKIRMHPVG